jgi:plastocyanin
MKPIPIIVLAVAFVSLAGCKSSSPAPAMPPVPKTVTVNILDNSYDPKSVQLNVGDTIHWVLVGADPGHTVTALSGAFDSGFIFMQPGDTFDRVFNQGNVTFEYSCQSHKACCAMQGSVLVGSMPPPPMIGY